jgi:hypothetical protein
MNAKICSVAEFFQNADPENPNKYSTAAEEDSSPTEIPSPLP